MIRDQHKILIGVGVEARIVYHVGDKVQGWYWTYGAIEGGPFYNSTDAENDAINWITDNVRCLS